MIISRTPLRMSFVGGGSDINTYYSKYGGAVFSSTIDKFIYINVNKKFDNGIRIAYSKTENVKEVNLIEHKIVKNALIKLGINGGVEITSIADIPSTGTGLGSSSAFTVGLLNALYAYQNKYISKVDLGVQSCNIEIDICREPIGKQDQYASSFGGMNLIEFMKDDNVNVTPLICKIDTIMELEESLIVFYTGITRSASNILETQKKGMDNLENQLVLAKMVDLTYILFKEMQSNNLSVFGEILHENWNLKKSLVKSISNTFIDECYEAAIRAGAIGGKILGAGAGGFLLFFAPKNKHAGIEKALSKLEKLNFSFENEGSKIIYYGK